VTKDVHGTGRVNASRRIVISGPRVAAKAGCERKRRAYAPRAVHTPHKEASVTSAGVSDGGTALTLPGGLNFSASYSGGAVQAVTTTSARPSLLVHRLRAG
jgi:hypothetical protein